MTARNVYEADIALRPTYHDGTPRKSWDQLSEVCRSSWKPLTQDQALAQLPSDAKWSSSFGNPGEGGFSEYYRTPDGQRYCISNGPWDGGANEWSIARVQS